MFLHCVWNTASTISGFLFLVMLPLWLFFVVAFLGILIWLVVRKGRIIRMHLQDEVLLGTMTREELDLVSSPVRRAGRATFGWGGAPGRKFVQTAARLGLSKWHAGRAMKGRKKTVSADWIVPLRQELGELRMAIARSLGRAVPMPQAWSPGQAPAQQQAWVPPQMQGQPQAWAPPQTQGQPQAWAPPQTQGQPQAWTPPQTQGQPQPPQRPPQTQ